MSNSQNSMLNDLLGIREIPTLALNDPSYTENLNANLQALKDNIDKILSVPFIQGAKGTSVEIGQFPLFTISRILGQTTNTSNDFNYMPTSIGQEILKVLFPLAFPNDSDIPGVNWRTLIDGYNGDQYIGIPEYKQIIENTGYHAYENLLGDFSNAPNNDTEWVPESITASLYYSVKNSAFNYNVSDTSTWDNIDILQSAAYFVFYDYRLKDLAEGKDSQCIFVDTSAAICRESYNESTEPDEVSIAYKFVNKNLLPTVYFNESLHMFCWCINGIETNIVCEGIAGKDGDSNVARLVQVDTTIEPIDDSTDGLPGYEIKAVYDSDSNRWIEKEIDIANFTALLNNGQMAIAFGDAIPPQIVQEDETETEETETEVYQQDIFFGIIQKISNENDNTESDIWVCYMNTDVSIRKATANISAIDIFDSLGTLDNVRGLYVKDGGWNENNPSTQFCHLLYSPSANIFNIIPVDYEYAIGQNNSTTTFNDKLLIIGGYSNIIIADPQYHNSQSFSSTNGIELNSNIGISLSGVTSITGNTSITGSTTIDGPTTLNYTYYSHEGNISVREFKGLTLDSNGVEMISSSNPGNINFIQSIKTDDDGISLKISSKSNAMHATEVISSKLTLDDSYISVIGHFGTDTGSSHTECDTYIKAKSNNAQTNNIRSKIHLNDEGSASNLHIYKSITADTSNDYIVYGSSLTFNNSLRPMQDFNFSSTLVPNISTGGSDYNNTGKICIRTNPPTGSHLNAIKVYNAYGNLFLTNTIYDGIPSGNVYPDIYTNIYLTNMLHDAIGLVFKYVTIGDTGYWILCGEGTSTTADDTVFDSEASSIISNLPNNQNIPQWLNDRINNMITTHNNIIGQIPISE